MPWPPSPSHFVPLALGIALGVVAVAASGEEPRPSAMGACEACVVELPDACVDAGLDVRACVGFYQRRVEDTLAIVRELVRSGPQGGGDDTRVRALESELREVRAAAENERARLAEKRDVLGRQLDLARRENRDLRRQLGLDGDDGDGISGGDDGREETSCPKPPTEQRIMEVLAAGAALFADLPPIRRDRLQQDLRAGRTIEAAVADAWPSRLRDREVRGHARNYLCDALPGACAAAGDDPCRQLQPSGGHR